MAQYREAVAVGNLPVSTTNLSIALGENRRLRQHNEELQTALALALFIVKPETEAVMTGLINKAFAV